MIQYKKKTNSSYKVSKGFSAAVQLQLLGTNAWAEKSKIQKEEESWGVGGSELNRERESVKEKQNEIVREKQNESVREKQNDEENKTKKRDGEKRSE